MSLRSLPALFLSVFLCFGACSGGSGSAPAPAATPLVVAAGMQQIEPAAADVVTATVDLARLGRGVPSRVYELTTPPGETFSFDVLVTGGAEVGTVRVAMAHARDGNVVPTGGPESVTAAGCMLSANGMFRSEPWIDAHGEGFGRMTISGAIDRDQVFAFQGEGPAGTEMVLVRVRLGARSAINTEDATLGNHPGVVSATTLYSSDSPVFGMPTAAVSGDRTSVVVYEGSRTNPSSLRRHELRLQHDAATGAVTGGGSVETNADTGNWRDHEIAALYNVLALGHCGDGKVTVKLSFDRGATFAQQQEFAGGSWSTRLVQLAMALDYSLAVVFWRAQPGAGELELMLVEGRPSAFDPNGSPTAFAFDPPIVLHRAPGASTPLLMGAAWSEGGDLVVGHAFTRTAPQNFLRTFVTEYHCAVRPWGGEFRSTQVDEESLIGRDPSVALLGRGPGLRIAYAYEATDGIRLRVSEDAGATFAGTYVVGSAGAYQPQVFVRDVSGAMRVDLLWLQPIGMGTELHACRWPVLGNSPREDHRLTTTVVAPSLLPPLNPSWPVIHGFRITQVAPFGYDAVLDGQQIVVVVDQETFDAAMVCLFAPSGTMVLGQPTGTIFNPAPPPPLAPGMTELLPAPDPAMRHQLRLLRID